MKNILAIAALILMIVSNAYAASSTSTVRTASGQLVSVGDSYISMIDRFQQAPVSSRSYEYKDSTGQYTATEYVYLLENTYYTITIVNNAVKSIVWDRKT